MNYQLLLYYAVIVYRRVTGAFSAVWITGFVAYYILDANDAIWDARARVLAPAGFNHALPAFHVLFANTVPYVFPRLLVLIAVLAGMGQALVRGLLILLGRRYITKMYLAKLAGSMAAGLLLVLACAELECPRHRATLVELHDVFKQTAAVGYTHTTRYRLRIFKVSDPTVGVTDRLPQELEALKILYPNLRVIADEKPVAGPGASPTKN